MSAWPAIARTSCMVAQLRMASLMAERTILDRFCDDPFVALITQRTRAAPGSPHR